MYTKITLFVTALFLLGCTLFSFNEPDKEAKDISTIAFGSCNRQDLDQPLWSFIVDNNPDLWIWLGDNIYGDTDDMNVLREKYALQKSNTGYQKLLNACPVIGIWDDHDFGRNDAGTGYPFKAQSQQLMLDFLDEPVNSERRSRKGAYTSNTYGSGENLVKVILLDSRYHRDTLFKSDKIYLPSENGDILGEEQWKWLEKELKESKAAVNIIGNGIQFISEEHPYEKWANFPKSRKRLFSLIGESKAKGVMLLSGDRHIAEIAKIEHPEVSYPVYEVTASGLTHAHAANLAEPNQYRLGKLVNVLNFGVMEFDWSKSSPEVKIEIKGMDNKVLESQMVVLNQ